MKMTHSAFTQPDMSWLRKMSKNTMIAARSRRRTGRSTRSSGTRRAPDSRFQAFSGISLLVRDGRAPAPRRTNVYFAHQGISMDAVAGATQHGPMKPGCDGVGLHGARQDYRGVHRLSAPSSPTGGGGIGRGVRAAGAVGSHPVVRRLRGHRGRWAVDGAVPHLPPRIRRNPMATGSGPRTHRHERVAWQGWGGIRWSERGPRLPRCNRCGQ